MEGNVAKYTAVAMGVIAAECYAPRHARRRRWQRCAQQTPRRLRRSCRGCATRCGEDGVRAVLRQHIQNARVIIAGGH